MQSFSNRITLVFGVICLHLLAAATCFSQQTEVEKEREKIEKAVAEWQSLKMDSLLHPVDCCSCQGEGTIVADCLRCEGEGKTKCTTCEERNYYPLNRGMAMMMAVYDVILPEQASKYRDSMKAAQATLKNPKMKSFLDPPDGLVRCPATCMNGKSIINAGHECKVCKGKGNLKCKVCGGKCKEKCSTCNGKKKISIPCPECAGLGKGNDPLKRSADAERCPWCNDAQIRNCHSCEKEGSRKVTCGMCAGKGKMICRACAGYGKTGCNKCSGTGDLSAYLAPKSSNKCDQCKASGTLKCGKCKSGKAKCSLCSGKKKIIPKCRGCVAIKVLACGGCALSSEQAWRITAERLFAAGMLAEAAAHMEVAVRRAYLRKGELLDSYAGDPKDLKSYKRELEKWVAELEKQSEEYQSMYQEKDSNGSNNSVPMSSSAPDQ